MNYSGRQLFTLLDAGFVSVINFTARTDLEAPGDLGALFSDLRAGTGEQRSLIADQGLK